MSYKEPLPFTQWEEICLSLFTQEVTPEQINWFEYLTPRASLQKQLNLFAIASAKTQIHPLNEKFKRSLMSFSFYEDYKDLASWVLCHRSESKFKPLYSVFCKACKDPGILSSTSDMDVLALKQLKKQVQKDVYKMQDNIKFETYLNEGTQVLYTWYEPEHFILQKNAYFLLKKYQGSDWIVFTPQGVLGHINQKTIYREEVAPFTQKGVEPQSIAAFT